MGHGEDGAARPSQLPAFWEQLSPHHGCSIASSPFSPPCPELNPAPPGPWRCPDPLGCGGPAAPIGRFSTAWAGVGSLLLGHSAELVALGRWPRRSGVNLQPSDRLPGWTGGWRPFPIGPPPRVSSTPVSAPMASVAGVGTLITPGAALQVGYWCGHVLAVQGPVLHRHGLPHQQSDAGCGADGGPDRLRAVKCGNLGLLSYPGGSRQLRRLGSGRRV